MGNHISRISQLDEAWKNMHFRLADFITKQIEDINQIYFVFEAGCSSGNLTIPFAKNINRSCKLKSYFAYDLWLGPYREGLPELRKAVVNEGLKDFVEIVKGNVRQIGIADEKIDLIVSNELFCDLDRSSLSSALKEFYRILKCGGQMVHSELDSIAENKAQELLIKADLEYSLESLPFEGERWFSPPVQELSNLIYEVGFKDIQVSFFKTNLRLSYEIAIEQFKRWKVDTNSFLKKYRSELKKYGIELPKMHVISCRKQ